MRGAMLLVVVIAGCSQREPAPDPPAWDAAPTPKKKTPPPVEDEPDEPPPPSLDDLQMPEGVPGLTKSVVDQPRSRRAQRLNAKALALHGDGQYTEAIELYKQALTIDPGNVLARYNLSCAYNLTGRSEAGLALLKQFYDTACDECRERLARASEDAEWHDRWDDPRFVQLVAIAAEKPVDRRWWLAESPCPDDTELSGAAPPKGNEIYCAKESGTKQGLATRWKIQGAGAVVLAEQGEYKNGKKQGPWLVFGENGYLAESGEFERGRREGPWSQWAKSGEQLADGRYKSGKKHGTWTHFTPAGAVERIEVWRDGKLVSSSP